MHLDIAFRLRGRGHVIPVEDGEQLIIMRRDGKNSALEREQYAFLNVFPRENALFVSRCSPEEAVDEFRIAVLIVLNDTAKKLLRKESGKPDSELFTYAVGAVAALSERGSYNELGKPKLELLIYVTTRKIIAGKDVDIDTLMGKLILGDISFDAGGAVFPKL